MSVLTVSNICVYQGEERSLPGTVKVGTAVQPITGDDLEFQVKKAIDDSDPPIISKSVSGTGMTITDGPNGEFTVDFLTADTSSLDPGEYRYSIVWLPSTGGRVVIVPPESAFTVLQALNPA